MKTQHSMPMDFDYQRRYARQTMLAELGQAGQEKIRGARVLVVGAGGLGAPLITYLAAAGTGTLGIIDADRVELSNLPRQIIHETGDVGRLKVESARDRVAELNPAAQVEIHPYPLTTANAHQLVAAYDIVADGCDNFATRLAVNAACVTLGKPLVSAAIAGWHGQVMSMLPTTACYACFLHPDAPEANRCRDSGVIGPLGGIIGSMQALEVLRLILGRPALAGRIALYNGLTATQRIAELTQDPACPTCGGTASRPAA